MLLLLEGVKQVLLERVKLFVVGSGYRGGGDTNNVFSAGGVDVGVEHDDASVLPPGGEQRPVLERGEAEHGPLVHAAHHLGDGVGAARPHRYVPARVTRHHVTWTTFIISLKR